MANTTLQKLTTYVGLLRELQKLKGKANTRYSQLELRVPEGTIISEVWFVPDEPELYHETPFKISELDGRIKSARDLLRYHKNAKRKKNK